MSISLWYNTVLQNIIIGGNWVKWAWDLLLLTTACEQLIITINIQFLKVDTKCQGKTDFGYLSCYCDISLSRVKQTWMGQIIPVLPCIFSYEALKRALLTSQRVLSEELDDLVLVEVLSGNSTTRIQSVPTLTERVPNKSCHSGLQWQARKKRQVFFFQHCFYASSTWQSLTTSLNDLQSLSSSIASQALDEMLAITAPLHVSWLRVFTYHVVTIWDAQPQLVSLEKSYPSQPDQCSNIFHGPPLPIRFLGTHPFRILRALTCSSMVGLFISMLLILLKGVIRCALFILYSWCLTSLLTYNRKYLLTKWTNKQPTVLLKHELTEAWERSIASKMRLIWGDIWMISPLIRQS